MRDEDFRFLLTPVGQAMLQELAGEPLTPDKRLSLIGRLRTRLTPEETAAVLETTLLRQRAAGKFSRASAMYFTRAGLEQATNEIVARYRAGRYVEAGFQTIADLGCGIGGDALTLAAQALVIAIDIIWLNVRMTQANAAVYGLADSILPVQADLETLPPMTTGAFFFDPARRTETSEFSAPSRRLHSPEAYRPPLSLIDLWRPQVPHGAVKVSPGIDYHDIPAEASAEFISLNGEVKECLLWYGDLRDRAGRRATLLPGGWTLAADAPDDDIPVSPPLAYLFEPDGAVIRAHLVRQVAHQLGASLIDPKIAYLTTRAPASTPFARCYRIDDSMPFQLKRLRQYLRERGIGQVTIKKRGSPLDPDQLRPQLRLQGDGHCVLFLTQAVGRPIVLIGQAYNEKLPNPPEA